MNYPIAPDEWFNNQIKKGNGVFEAPNLARALLYKKNNGIALDVGCHVGSWSIEMAKHFTLVYAFEADIDNFEYLIRNTVGIKNINCENIAIGEKNGFCEVLKGERNSGQSYIGRGDRGVRLSKLDNIFPKQNIDFLKVDVEGYEYMVFSGAEKLLRRSDAVIIWENNGLSEKRYGISADLIKATLEEYGYRHKETVHYDEIWIKN